MKHMNFQPAFCWRFRDSLKGVAVFALVMLAIYALTFGGLSIFMSDDFEVEGTFSAWSFSAAVMVFVFGIVSIRDDMRLFSQFGTSRTTTFGANLLGSAAVIGILAVAGELFNGFGALIAGRVGSVTVTDLFELLYYQAKPFDFAGRCLSGLFTFALLLSAYGLGLFLTMCFYRLPKAGKIILAIALPTVILNGLPLLLSRIIDLAAVVGFIGAEPLRLILFLIVAALVTAGLGFLLFRRAPIRAAKK